MEQPVHNRVLVYAFIVMVIGILLVFSDWNVLKLLGTILAAAAILVQISIAFWAFLGGLRINDSEKKVNCPENSRGQAKSMGAQADPELTI